MARTEYAPVDMRCPACHAHPGERCHSVVITGRPLLRRPHAERVTAATQATRHRQAPKVPATVTDAWTCPACHRSYWPPREWEPEVWPVLLRLLQQMHGSRHRAEAADHAGTD